MFLTKLWFEKCRSGDYLQVQGFVEAGFVYVSSWRGPKSMDKIDGSAWPDLPSGSATGGSTVAET